MQQHSYQHMQMSKLLVKERLLEMGRLSIWPVTFSVVWGRAFLQLNKENESKLRQFNLKSTEFEVHKIDYMHQTQPTKAKVVALEDGRLELVGSAVDTRFQYNLIPRNATIYRELENLGKMHEMDNQIFNFIKEPSKNPIGTFDIPYDQKDLEGLNDSQKQAVKMAMKNKICLIRGPPGTGKTRTISKIVQLLAKAEQKYNILVCGPSNVAVDVTTRAVLNDCKNPETITRFTSERAAKKICQQLSCVNFSDKVLLHVKNNFDPAFYEFFETNLTKFINKQELVERGRYRVKDFNIARTKAYNSVIAETQIMCTTMITSGSGILKQFCPNIIIADQASQSIEAQLIVSLNKGATKVILFGDDLQLPPTVVSNNAVLKVSLFKRILQARPELHVMLNIQYRMHPLISKFPNEEFYRGLIKNGITAEERTSQYEMFSKFPFTLWDCRAQEMKRDTSYYNPEQVKIIKTILEKFKQDDMKTIGIITGFVPQGQLLSKELQKYLDMGLQIKTFDGYQGNEKDYVIISFVRSNQAKIIGFLQEASRANVALTRAKRGVILVGNMETIQSDNNNNYNPWKNFVQYATNLGVKIQNLSEKNKEKVVQNVQNKQSSQKIEHEKEEQKPSAKTEQVMKPQLPSAKIEFKKKNKILDQLRQEDFPLPQVAKSPVNSPLAQTTIKIKPIKQKTQQDGEQQDNMPSKKRKKMKGQVVNLYETVKTKKEPQILKQWAKEPDPEPPKEIQKTKPEQTRKQKKKEGNEQQDIMPSKKRKKVKGEVVNIF